MLILIAKNRDEAEAFAVDRRLYFGVAHRIVSKPVQMQSVRTDAQLVLIGDYWRGHDWKDYYEWLLYSKASVLYGDELPLYDPSDGGV